MASGGGLGNGDSGFASISDNGQQVAFSSTASNLVNGDGNGVHDIFVRDLAAGTTKRVSVSSTGAGGNGPSIFPSISSNGSVVAFVFDATNLVPRGHQRLPGRVRPRLAVRTAGPARPTAGPARPTAGAMVFVLAGVGTSQPRDRRCPRCLTSRRWRTNAGRICARSGKRDA